MTILKKIGKGKRRVIALVLITYCLTYFGWSRTFLYVNKEHIQNIPQISFVPFEWLGTTHGQVVQGVFRYFFYPIWCVDRVLFGAPPMSTHVDTKFKV